MLEDGGDDVWVLDASNDAQLAAAFGAGPDVDREYPFQALHPGDGSEGLVSFFFGFALQYEALAVFAVRSEHAVEASAVESWARYQCCQPGDEVERIENEMRRAVTKRLFEFVDDLSSLARS